MYRYFQESRKVTFHAKVTSMSNRLPQCRLAVQEWIWHIRICQIKKKAKDKEKKKNREGKTVQAILTGHAQPISCEQQFTCSEPIMLTTQLHIRQQAQLPRNDKFAQNLVQK